MNAAIAHLEIALEVLETNEPIHRTEGDIEQADCEASSAVEIRQALAVLKQNAAATRRAIDAVNFYQQHEMAAHKKCDELEAQLAERDKTILEQQAHIAELTLLGGRFKGDPILLEAALKAERIKTLEDAADHLDGFPIRVVGNSAATQNDCTAELRRMANELKGQS